MRKVWLIKYLILSSLVASLPCISGFAQHNAIEVLQKATKFSSLYPQEKVYLHFDNTGYFKGETIWYKAYVVTPGINPKSENQESRSSSSTNDGNDSNDLHFVYRNSDLSRVLYVELLSPGGDVLETQKLHIDDDGGAWGQIKLDSILGTGFYEVRAYTRYLLNWGVNAMFSRVFPIFEAPQKYGDYSHPTISKVLYKDRNPNSRMADSLYLAAAKDGIYTDDAPEKISAHFYPEGGDLVQGLKSRVAVMVIDDNGSAYAGRGGIVNEAGETVCRVETDSTGRGIFEITPTGEKLWLTMQNYKKRRNIQRFPLPVVKSEGTVINLDVISDQIMATITTKYSAINSKLQEGGYAVMHDGRIVTCDTMRLYPLIELELDRNHLPGGVNQLTVFNSEGQILSERMFWIYPKPEAGDSILFTPISKGLGPCSEVEILAKTKPNSTFSFSATDYGSMTGGKEGSARTWMLLSSDVKGYIANIDYYFESDDMEHREKADMLMMVQGWRRYDWEIMTGRKWFDSPQPIEDGLFLYGRLREYRKKNPVRNVELDTYLFNRQGQSLHGVTRTDSLGNYALKVPDISDEWELQIFTKINDKRKTFYVGIDRQFAPTPRFITPSETRLIQKSLPTLSTLDNGKSLLQGESQSPQLNYAEKVHVIPQVTVKARKKFFTNDNIQWYNQREGRHWATVYYNGPEELDKFLDRGEAVPSVFEFLARRNPMFNNAECFDLPRLSSKTGGASKEEKEEDDEVDMSEIWEGHMSYGGRKIRWIIDNGLATFVSDEGHFVRIVGANSFDDIIEFPKWMDEVKAIYIVPWSPREEESSVRIYLYRQIRFTTESQKGLRRTHFRGYNIPETFSMEDLRVLPPLENLRRTLFWEPNIKTDANGEAKIIFYNNLSATQIQLSAEGLSPDGHVLVGE
ncbi:MAG: hypothetical protein KBT06_11825 [Prevotellaceae bacterium]|nr:hypothetical protein [Candidatus Colivivens equi]